MKCGLFFFFNDTATTEIYTLSLHDALPISYAYRDLERAEFDEVLRMLAEGYSTRRGRHGALIRSEEHTSELQSQSNLVCRLLLEKNKNTATFCTCNVIHVMSFYSILVAVNS